MEIGDFRRRTVDTTLETDNTVGSIGTRNRPGGSKRSGGRDQGPKEHSGNVVQISREGQLSLPRNSGNTESTKSTSCTALALVRNQVLISLRKLIYFSRLA